MSYLVGISYIQKMFHLIVQVSVIDRYCHYINWRDQVISEMIKIYFMTNWYTKFWKIDAAYMSMLLL